MRLAPIEAAVAGALWTPRFASDHPADARLLLEHNRQDLLAPP